MTGFGMAQEYTVPFTQTVTPLAACGWTTAVVRATGRLCITEVCLTGCAFSGQANAARIRAVTARRNSSNRVYRFLLRAGRISEGVGDGDY